MIVYTVCIPNYAHKIAVFNFFFINITVFRAMAIVVNEAWLS